MRETYLNKLEILNQSLIDMGNNVEYALARSVRALLDRDMDLAAKTIEFDKDIDQEMKEIERQCINLLMRQQPVAKDLRFISAALKMVSDLERIGDQAADIAEICLQLSKDCDVNSIPEISQMTDAVKVMLRNSVKAVVDQNVDLAFCVCDSDDAVDSLFYQAKFRLISMIKSNEKNSIYAMDLFMITKYLERIGDHTVNVANWVIFSDSGIHNGVNLMGYINDKLDEK